MEYYLTEMQYSNYAAKEELVENLSELSRAYDLPDLTLEQVEVLNELSLATVGVYVTKVTSSVAKAFADFKAGYQDSMWISYKKIHKDTFSSTFEMKSAESGITLPKLKGIRDFLAIKLKEWKDVEDKEIPDREAFYKLDSAISPLYDKDKSASDRVNDLYFEEHKDTIIYTAASIVQAGYITFMNDYSKLQDHIAADIKAVNIAAKEIKAEAENAQAEAKKAAEKAKADKEKAEQEAQKAKAEADREKENAEREAQQEKQRAEAEAKSESTVFNFANALLEAFILNEEGKNKFSANEQQPESAESDDTPEKPAVPLSDEDFTKKLNKITTFFTGTTEVLSAKMKALNKARSLSFDLIKQYCKLAEAAKKKDKKENKNNTTEEPEKAEEKK